MNKIPELKNNWIIKQYCPNCQKYIKDVSFTLDIKSFGIRVVICPFCGILFQAEKVTDRILKEFEEKRSNKNEHKRIGKNTGKN